MNKSIRNEEELKNTIDTILCSINETENPVELSEYKKFFQKNVPLTRRSYVAAFLLKNSNIAGKMRSISKVNNNTRFDRKRGRLRNNESSKNEKCLFLNIGRLQGINPAEIREFLESANGIEKTDIGYITIHHNFSFVNVQNEKVDSVISSLDGKELKGKNIAVCVAKKQK